MTSSPERACPTASDRRAIRREVERLCVGMGAGASALDGRELRARLIEVLSRTVGLDWYVWVLIDPVTQVGVDPLAEVPDLTVLPTVVRLKYATAVNRWTTLDDVASLGTDAPTSPLWRDAQARHGIVDVLSAVCRDRHGTWAFFDLWTTGSPYAADDLALVRDLLPVVTRALRDARAATFATGPSGPPEVVDPAPTSPAVLLLDDDLTIVGRSPGSDEWLARLLPAEPGCSPVPAAALNVAAQLLASEAGVDHHDPQARVHVADGQWVTLRASRLDPGRQIAVTIELATPEERLDLFARSHGLSVREREVVAVLLSGADTATAAGRLFVSPHTVQDHLKSVFAKSGVRARRDLITRVLGACPEG